MAAQRISGLSAIDPLAVPLPHGTEVTTRVERTLNGRHIPQGLIGRVVREHDGGVDVLIVGVGELWLSGAHAYGFPSPNSDLDLKAVHVDETAELLGFPRPSEASERLEEIDGVEIDYSSNELGGVLWGVLKGNGNYVERFLSGYLVWATPELSALQPLVSAALSKKLTRHYRGSTCCAPRSPGSTRWRPGSS